MTEPDQTGKARFPEEEWENAAEKKRLMKLKRQDAGQAGGSAWEGKTGTAKWIHQEEAGTGSPGIVVEEETREDNSQNLIYYFKNQATK